MIIDSRSYFLKLSALGKQMASSSSAQVREGLLKCAKWLVTIQQNIAKLWAIYYIYTIYKNIICIYKNIICIYDRYDIYNFIYNIIYNIYNIIYIIYIIYI